MDLFIITGTGYPNCCLSLVNSRLVAFFHISNPNLTATIFNGLDSQEILHLWRSLTELQISREIKLSTIEVILQRSGLFLLELLLEHQRWVVLLFWLWSMGRQPRILFLTEASTGQGKHAAVFCWSAKKSGTGGPCCCLYNIQGDSKSMFLKDLFDVMILLEGSTWYYHSLMLTLVLPKVPGNETPSLLISFAMKSVVNGQLVSRLHIIELGAQPGCVWFSFALLDTRL